MILSTPTYHSRFETQYIALNQLTELALTQEIEHLRVELLVFWYRPIRRGAELILDHFQIPTLLPIMVPLDARTFSVYLGLTPPCTLQSKMSVARHLGAVLDLFSLPACTLEMKQAFEKVAKAGIEEHELQTSLKSAG